MKLIIFSNIFFLLFGCSSFFKPAIQNHQEDLILMDKKYIFVDSNLPIKKGNEYEDIKNLDIFVEDLKDWKDKNNYSIYLISNSNFYQAADMLSEILNENLDEITLYLNLSHLYFSIDNYAKAREIYSKYIERNYKDRKKIESFAQYLKENLTKEEKVLFMDVLSQKPEYKIESLEFLGQYNYQIGQYDQAEAYFGEILSTHTYNLISVRSMFLISLEKEDWRDAIMYGKILIQLKQTFPEFYTMMMRAYYENGDYSQVIIISKKAPIDEQKNYTYISILENTLLSISLNYDYTQIKKLYEPLYKNNTIKSMSPFGQKEGHRFYKNIIRGN